MVITTPYDVLGLKYIMIKDISITLTLGEGYIMKVKCMYW